MAKSKQPRKKKPAEPAVSVEVRLAESLAQKTPARAAIHADQPAASVGDKVSFGTSNTIYTISRVSPSGTQVDLRLEGTNIERFRVSVDDLNFLERSAPPRQPAKPAKPAIDVEEVHERLTSAQKGSMDQLSGDIAVLKKYLKSKGVPASAGDELDELCEAQEKRWTAAIEEIMDSLPAS